MKVYVVLRRSTYEDDTSIAGVFTSEDAAKELEAKIDREERWFLGSYYEHEIDQVV